MDTALYGSLGTLNGLDVAIWVGFFVLTPRILRWAYAKRPSQVQEQPVSQPVTPPRVHGTPAQLKLAV